MIIYLTWIDLRTVRSLSLLREGMKQVVRKGKTMVVESWVDAGEE